MDLAGAVAAALARLPAGDNLCLPFAFCWRPSPPRPVGGLRVAFDEDGTALVNGKPCFPIGLFTYSLDDPTVAEIRKQRFNTVSLLTEHHQPAKLDWVQKEGWMARLSAGRTVDPGWHQSPGTPRLVCVRSIAPPPAEALRGLFDHHTFKPVQNRFTEKLEPYATRAYVWGAEPSGASQSRQC